MVQLVHCTANCNSLCCGWATLARSQTHSFFNFHFINAWNDSLALVLFGLDFETETTRSLCSFALAMQRRNLLIMNVHRLSTLGENEWTRSNERAMRIKWTAENQVPYTNEHTNNCAVGSLRLSAFYANEQTPCASDFTENVRKRIGSVLRYRSVLFLTAFYKHTRELYGAHLKQKSDPSKPCFSLFFKFTFGFSKNSSCVLREIFLSYQRAKNYTLVTKKENKHIDSPSK